MGLQWKDPVHHPLPTDALGRHSVPYKCILSSKMSAYLLTSHCCYKNPVKTSLLCTILRKEKKVLSPSVSGDSNPQTSSVLGTVNGDSSWRVQVTDRFCAPSSHVSLYKEVSECNLAVHLFPQFSLTNKGCFILFTQRVISYSKSCLFFSAILVSLIKDNTSLYTPGLGYTLRPS